MRLFDSSRPFFRGNLHTHTTMSDGRLSPEEVMRLYKDSGTDFLAITDHWKESAEGEFEGMLLLAGIELDTLIDHQCAHIVGIGFEPGLLGAVNRQMSAQAFVDAINGAGGRAILAHPAWSLNTPDFIRNLRGIAATEIFNTFSGAPWQGNRSDSSAILDVATAMGATLKYVASDDSHFYTGEACRSYTVCQADELSAEAIKRALDEGSFFASQGPMFHQVAIENGELVIDCSPVSEIMVYSNQHYVANRCLTHPNQTEAHFPLRPSEKVIRAEIIDAEGRRAWTSPMAL